MSAQGLADQRQVKSLRAGLILGKQFNGGPNLPHRVTYAQTNQRYYHHPPVPAGVRPGPRPNQRHTERGEEERHNWKDSLSPRARLYAFSDQKSFEILPDANIGAGALQMVFALRFQDWGISTRARSGGVALSVILGAALWVNQNIPGMRQLTKGARGFGRAAVEIRMLQAREPLVCRLDLFL